ncbi:MAG: alanine:cation symporter family protein [Psychrobacter sp.]|uniref:Alanine/glycine:cation symporter family protein n=1 Tax=Psychrobacter namhaensis TaxID=292734 RepID=A0ABW8LBU3_9GAMM|nr:MULTISPECIES: alanine/glycine:cation symporter family protein [unclassified Psychrobacter]MCD1279487.1 alanine:cation symporter family protein [Psychrobacter sp. CCUG 69069]MCD6252197.1 alanine:cation symporter family protein [Psychrobacter sp.]
MSEGVAGWFNNIVNYGVGIIWGNNDWLIASNPWYGLLMFLLIGAGLYFTVVTRFIQFRHFGHMWQLLRVSNQGRKDGGISSFEALMTSLAARVGTGNLAGVAIAIYLGGPGAVFWMWMTAIVGMSTSFIESTLAQAYKVPHNDNVYRGGPAYYIEKGLGKRWLAIFFSVCLLVAFGLAFNGVQSNTIAQATNEAFGVPTWMTGAVLVALVAPVVFGGLRSVARIAGKIVPIMAILYILLALFIIVTNFSQFPAAIVLIVKSAFGFEQAAGGVIGYGIAQAMINGIKRGLFSNEAGMGSAPNAAATAKSHPDHPAVQGFMQMLGVFMDTLIICTATASIIILSGVVDPNVEQEGIQLTQLALSQYVGDLGIIFVAIAIFFFSFTSIIANYSYGESNLEFISGTKNAKVMIMIFRFMVLGMVFVGAVASLPAIWNFADLSMGLMALVNLVAILMLSPVALRILRDYERQVKEGKTGDQIKFDPDDFVKLKDEANRDAWTD